MSQNQNKNISGEVASTPSAVGVSPTFRKSLATMIEERLYAIPETNMEELQRHTRTEYIASTATGAGFSCAVTMFLQWLTTEDSHPVWTWVIFAISLTLGIVSLFFWYLSFRDKATMLDRLKKASKTVDSVPLMQAIAAQSVSDIQADPPQSTEG